jgi:transcriptional regulator with XRE-family HTH domain
MRSLKVLRVERGLTQEQVYNRSGISMSRISLIETNKYIPSETEQHRLAKVLGVKKEDVAWPELKAQ